MNNIKAKVICDSISNNIRITTVECEYPRFILSELNTHRMLSKNSSSSRAIPIRKMHEQILTNPAMPLFYGKNQPGMTASQELDSVTKEKCIQLFNKLKDISLSITQDLIDLDLHKQTANRLLEPFMMMKTVITATEYNNFFQLRIHKDAQPELCILATLIKEAIDNNTPQQLKISEWHLPYVEFKNNKYYSKDQELTLEQAQQLSVSCCAQVSYRTTDLSLEKSSRIYKLLTESNPPHMSPLEHQATPIDPQTLQGVTHKTRNGDLYSGNLRGWMQFRKLHKDEAKW